MDNCHALLVDSNILCILFEYVSSGENILRLSLFFKISFKYLPAKNIEFSSFTGFVISKFLGAKKSLTSGNIILKSPP